TPEQLVAHARKKPAPKLRSHTAEALAPILDGTHVETKRSKATAPAVPPITHIEVRGARQHNLRSVDIRIPREQFTVCCGPSGSGKTSLAMDTIYAEGQRRYVESLSSYA